VKRGFFTHLFGAYDTNNSTFAPFAVDEERFCACSSVFHRAIA
jgi:hypothetical protein